jgi:hypothetical protein
MGRTRKVQNQDQKRCDRWRPKSGACSSYSLTLRGLFTKNSSWKAKQSIPHATVMFYSDCLKMCQDFAPKFGDKRTGCCIMTMHHLTLPFSPGNFLWKEQHDCLRLPALLFSVSQGESQVVLNTLTEHYFHDAFKNNGRNTGKGAYAWKGTTSRVMVASRPSRPDGSTSPGNYGWLFVYVLVKCFVHVY